MFRELFLGTIMIDEAPTLPLQELFAAFRPEREQVVEQQWARRINGNCCRTHEFKMTEGGEKRNKRPFEHVTPLKQSAYLRTAVLAPKRTTAAGTFHFRRTLSTVLLRLCGVVGLSGDPILSKVNYAT